MLVRMGAAFLLGVFLVPPVTCIDTLFFNTSGHALFAGRHLGNIRRLVGLCTGFCNRSIMTS